MKVRNTISRAREAVKSNTCLYRVLLPLVNVVRYAREKVYKARVSGFRRRCLRLSRSNSELVFAKVGANDGITGDPCSDILLSNSAWSGVLIEPVHYCFIRLRENFPDPKRHFLEQVAIGPNAGSAPFYFVDQSAIQTHPELPSYYDQLGSFDRTHILKHLNGILEPYIVESEVEICTLTDVLNRNGISKLHLLHIDTEGYDFEVLKTLDFTIYQPLMIFVEHKHLAGLQKKEMRKFLRGKGYSVRNCGGDYFAFNKKARTPPPCQ